MNSEIIQRLKQTVEPEVDAGQASQEKAKS
ncbi:hypothetical protein EBB79_19720 [Parasedimentitalea marina]|uniref:Uncharacterized protein n=1 Tax=Parasedimentitalea marina TaxID=2483033 RepID=A0A3T0N785_9RHOB|nr:hypothetical protein EBB79_19720 [Parasedimentitalea marina]